MTDLDRRCAEAQGWKLHGEGIVVWVGEDGMFICGEEDYTPSTDLNQAVAFAEWARTKLSDCYFKIMDDLKGWEVIVREIAQPNKLRGWAVLASLAEALCLATLQALEEPRVLVSGP